MTDNTKRPGSQKFDPVREAALRALVLIQQGDQTEFAVKSVMADQDFSPLDRRFLMQLVNGATKMRRRLDHEIKFYLSKPSQDLPLKLANILRLGLYQLRFTDRIPDAAAVNESVKLAAHMLDRSRANLVNAVLRASIREPDKVQWVDVEDEPVRFLGDYYSYPDHFVEYCLEEFGMEQTKVLLDRYNRPPHVTYRVNYLKSKPDEVARLLQENETEFSYGKYLPEFLHVESGGLPMEAELIRTGKVFVQDESAGLAVRLLNPRPNTTMVDLTAAPGGKATYAAIRMRNRGRVTAVDKSHQRLVPLVENAQRLGIKIISPVASDMLDFKAGQFDRVLLDPPCSGWGTAGKNSDLRWTKTADDVTHLTRIQHRMLEHAATLVKPGGILVYSTCTIMRAENDQLVEEWLAKNPEFEVDSAAQFYDESIVTERGFVKTYPGHDKLDGSFCARLKRRS